MANRVALLRARPEARHARARPRLWAGGIVHLSLPRVRGPGLGNRPLAQRRGESERIRDAGLDGGILPIHADARSLPFATEFFDAVVCIDSFGYYGTDDLYLNYLARFVKPDGIVGIAGAGLVREIDGSVPEHLRQWWTQDVWSLHSASWWRRHWERTGIMEICLADSMTNGWQRWQEWLRMPLLNESEISTLEADGGDYLAYVRIAGRRRGEATLADHIVSVPAQYMKKPLLR